MPLSANPLVSVIIPSKNSASRLEACLSSIRNQTYQHIEIIAVIPALREDIRDVLQKYATTPVVCICGKNACRNVGAKAAQGTYLLHLDDDMQLDPSLIAECVQLAADRDVEAIAIPEIETDGSGLYKSIRRLERQIVFHDDNIEAPRFISAQIYKQVGGINVDLDPIDEGDLKEKLSEHGIAYVRTQNVIHVSHLSERNILLDRWIRFYYRGQKRALFNTLHPCSKQLKPYARIKPYFRNGTILLKNPLAGMCLMGVKFIDLCVLNLGQLSTTLSTKNHPLKTRHSS